MRLNRIWEGTVCIL